MSESKNNVVISKIEYETLMVKAIFLGVFMPKVEEYAANLGVPGLYEEIIKATEQHLRDRAA